MENKVTYKEIARASITDSREVVISDCSKGGYTIAQQVTAEEGGKKITFFAKGALHVDDVYGLCELRDLLNDAIGAVQRGRRKNAW